MRPSSQRGVQGFRGPVAALLLSALVLLISPVAFVPGADAATPQWAAVPGPAAMLDDDEATFVLLVNEYRAAHSLPPLTIDLVLMATAQQWTSVMSGRGTIFHAEDLSIGVPDGWAKLGENVGYAPVGQVQVLFEAFVASPLHRANLLDEGFDRIGVSVVEADDGRIYTTHRFMETTEAQPMSAMERAHHLMTRAPDEPTAARP